MIAEERIRHLNEKAVKPGRYVLYWMQQAQRAEYNHALEYAIDYANELSLPVAAYFGITEDYPEANERHYYFMLEGLREVSHVLKDRGIRMVIRRESPETGATALGRDAALVVVDGGYTRIQRQWRRNAASELNCRLVQVESDVVVPVEAASEKEEYSAATLRRKLSGMIEDYLVPLAERRPKLQSLSMDFESFDIEDVATAVAQLRINQSVGRVEAFAGGTSHVKRLLGEFIEGTLDRFDEDRNDPSKDGLSNMSPYIHFGQISPLYVALQIKEARSPGTPAYLEELVVRRELAVNFVYYNDDYDSFSSLPDWASTTLSEHSDDPREVIYTAEQFERAETQDPYWNAAQSEMVRRGKMHGYMRMYWGKKILEWSRTPEEAYATALRLNNRYELDGRDPNGFAGVAWCFGKHDRPWGRRPIFGMVRYMSADGLRRKFDIERYVESVSRLP